MDAYFINTLKVQKGVFFHVSFMSSCTSPVYRLSDLTRIPRTMQPIISSPSEKHAAMLTLKQTKTPRLALKSAYVFPSGGPKLAVVSLTSDERSCGKKYSTPTSFWFDLLRSLIVCVSLPSCDPNLRAVEGHRPLPPCFSLIVRHGKWNMQEIKFRDHLKWQNILTGPHNTCA